MICLLSLQFDCAVLSLITVLRIYFLLPPANEVWDKVIFSQVFVCPQGCSLYDVTSCLAAWCHVPSGGSAYSKVGVYGEVCLQWGLPTGGEGGQTPPESESRRYTFYWNVFLFHIYFHFLLLKCLGRLHPLI